MATYAAGQKTEVLDKLRSGRVFREDTLRQLNLDRENLSGLSLLGGRLERCSLGNAVLEGARLDGCRVLNTSMRQIIANDTAWVDTRARLSDLAAATMHRACFNACRFEESLMAGMDFEGATLTDCEFDICDMTGASFKDSLMVRCRFRDNRLGSANLMSTCFDGAQLVDVDLRDANLQYASFKGALLVRVHLQGANLQSADMEGATFVEVRGLPDEVRDRLAAAQRQAPPPPSRARARAVDIDLDRGLAQMSHDRLVGITRELLRTYVIEASVALLSEDPAAALLRQRSLRFADLIRFVKENFPHEEFKQILVEGDAVYVRTPAGDLPLTNYGNSPVQVPVPPPAPPANYGGAPESETRSPLPPASLPPNMPRREGTDASEAGAPDPFDSPRQRRSGGERPAESPPDQRREQPEPDSFEPDRWGMIDL